MSESSYLPRDVTRCWGKVYDDTQRPLPALGPALECMDCRRRTDRSVNAFPLVFMSAPDEYPCPMRIGDAA